MASKLRKPILVGGVGISFTLWLWSSFQHSLMQVGELSVLGMIALGTGVWFFQRKAAKALPSAQVPSPLDLETVEKAIADAEAMVTQLEAETDGSDVAEWKQQLAQLPDALNRQQIQVAITGGKNVGKTSLKQVLDESEITSQNTLVETEPLFTGSDAEVTTEKAAQEVAFASDLVLFVTGGDLTDSEFQTLQQLSASHQRLLLIFNQQDHYLPEERAMILQQLRQRSQQVIAVEDVVAISASPAPVKVRRHSEDGSMQEWMEQPQPEITALRDRTSQILSAERQQLVWATTWRTAVGLKTKAKTQLNEIRQTRALPVIEQYQWIAAAAAFANPVATLDLVSTAAINGQMVVELGEIYQQKFSWQQAQTAAGTLGKLMAQLGLVELSTQMIGGILKSNAFTYVAGGVVEGVSAAYLTRVAGLSLIEYFQEQDISTTSEEPLHFHKLKQKLQNVFQRNQRTAFLQGFVKQTAGRLSREYPQSQSISSQMQMPTN